MTNRTEKQLEDFKEEISKEWQLSLTEVEFLENALNILKERSVNNRLNNILGAVDYQNWEKVLQLIPQAEIEVYAANTFFKNSLPTSIEEFSDSEIVIEALERGLSVNVSKLDVVTESQLKDLTSKFLAADFETRNRMLTN